MGRPGIVANRIWRLRARHIKLTNKLTMGADFRWDFEPPRTERFNREVFWDDSYKWDVTLNPVFNWQNDWLKRESPTTFPNPMDDTGFLAVRQSWAVRRILVARFKTFCQTIFHRTWRRLSSCCEHRGTSQLRVELDVSHR